MDIHIHIPTRLVACVRRRHVALATAIALTAVTAVAVAFDVPYPKFVAGDKISADQVNKNFAKVAEALTALQVPKATQLCKSFESTGKVVYKGGSPVGYAAVKLMCTEQEGCLPTAHLCTGAEIASLAAQKGLAKDFSVRYLGLSAGPDAVGPPVSDCLGFTSADASHASAVIAYGVPAAATCEKSMHFACCQ